MTICETRRLLIRHLTPDDAPFILELLNEPSFIANVADRGVRSVDEARSYISSGPVASYEQNGHGLYLVELRETGESIGICGLLRRPDLDAPDVGFAFLPRYWSRGYARESAEAVIRFGRTQLGMDRITALVAPHNAASLKVLDSLGFTPAGTVSLANAARVCCSSPLQRLLISDTTLGASQLTCLLGAARNFKGSLQVHLRSALASAGATVHLPWPRPKAAGRPPS